MSGSRAVSPSRALIVGLFVGGLLALFAWTGSSGTAGGASTGGTRLTADNGVIHGNTPVLSAGDTAAGTGDVLR